MAYYSYKDIEKAKQLDLFSYLQMYEPEELVHYSKNTYMTKTHDSLKISNGMWYWFSRGVGGKTALEYLIKVRNYTFVEAVECLLGVTTTKPIGIYKQPEKERLDRLILPRKAGNCNKVKAYLIKRGIAESIIQECIDNELIYQQYSNNNVVFVGYDKNNIPRYAGIRATNSSRYMQEASGSHKAFSFKIDANEASDTLHIFESAIDLLSYATLLNICKLNWKKDSLLSLAGVYQPAKNISESKIPIALSLYLNNNPNIKKIVLRLDNDKAGRTATEALKIIIPKQYEIIDRPPEKGKDYNDFLCIYRNKKYLLER